MSGLIFFLEGVTNLQFCSFHNWPWEFSLERKRTVIINLTCDFLVLQGWDNINDKSARS